MKHDWRAYSLGHQIVRAIKALSNSTGATKAQLELNKDRAIIVYEDIEYSEFNEAALRASQEGKELTVERIFISKTLRDLSGSRARIQSISNDLQQKTPDNYYEKDAVVLKGLLYGTYLREAHYETKRTASSSYIRDGNTVSISGSLYESRNYDSVTMHVAYISRPDLIETVPEAAKIINIATEFNMKANFSIEQTPEINRGNQVINREVPWPTPYYKDVVPSKLVLTFTRN